jgi:hypothetical protein
VAGRDIPPQLECGRKRSGCDMPPDPIRESV